MNWTDEALEKSLKKIERNIEAIGEHFPHVAPGGIYNDQGLISGYPASGPVSYGFYMKKQKTKRLLSLPEN